MVTTTNVDDLGLTPRQSYCVSMIYSDGHTVETVAGWLGVTPRAVKAMIRRAKATLKERGYPQPRPYGRGNRAELRCVLPGVCGDA